MLFSRVSAVLPADNNLMAEQNQRKFVVITPIRSYPAPMVSGSDGASTKITQLLSAERIEQLVRLLFVFLRFLFRFSAEGVSDGGNTCRPTAQGAN